MSEELLRAAQRTLKTGEAIAYSDETGTFLLADSLGDALLGEMAKAAKLKQVGFQLLINDLTLVERYVSLLPYAALDLMEVSDRPLLVIFPSGKNVAPNLLAPDGSLAIRLVGNQLIDELIYRIRRPIAALPIRWMVKGVEQRLEGAVSSILGDKQAIHLQEDSDKNMLEEWSVIRFDNDGRVSILRG